MGDQRNKAKLAALRDSIQAAYSDITQATGDASAKVTPASTATAANAVSVSTATASTATLASKATAANAVSVSTATAANAVSASTATASTATLASPATVNSVPVSTSPTSDEMDAILASLLGKPTSQAPTARQNHPGTARRETRQLGIAKPSTNVAQPSSPPPGSSQSSFLVSNSPATLNPPRLTSLSSTRSIPGSLGAGWSDYYRKRLAEDPDATWLDDIDDSWPDDQLYFDNSSISDGEEEAPRHLIWPMVLTAIAVFIVLTGAITLNIRNMQVSVEIAALERQTEAASLLNESLAFIQEADLVVVALDKMLDSQITTESLMQLESLIDQVEGAQQTLDSAITRALDARSTFSDPANQAIAEQAIQAGRYRKQLLNLGVQLARADIAAKQSAMQLDIAWDAIIAADSLMREAVSIVTTGEHDQVVKSLSLNQEALIRLQEAETAIKQADEFFPEADFTTLLNYVIAKQQSCDLVIASDLALINDDLKTANALTEQFYIKDAEVIELALLIPDDPLSIIVVAYGEKTGDRRLEYQGLRDNAADADVYLREWLAGANR